MQKINNKLILLLVFLITACSGGWDDVKRGLGGYKGSSTDEFLVKKKEPLTMPPKFSELPKPGRATTVNNTESIVEVTDIEELLQSSDNEITQTNNNQNRSLEESLLKKMKEK